MPLGVEKAALMGSGAGAALKMLGAGGTQPSNAGYDYRGVNIWNSLTDAWTSGTSMTGDSGAKTSYTGNNFIQGPTGFDGMFYSIYGYSPGNAGITTNLEYNYSADTSATRTSGPSPGRYSFGCMQSPALQYCCSGMSWSNNTSYVYYSDVDAYAFATDSWTSKTNTPLAVLRKWYNCMLSDDTNKVYIAMGMYKPGATWTKTDACRTYSVSGDSYTTITSANTEHMATSGQWIDDINGKMYCPFGYKQGASPPIRLELIYTTLATEAWNYATSSPANSRAGAYFGQDETYGYYSAGEEGSASPTGYTNTGGSYNMITDTWATGTPTNQTDSSSAGVTGSF